MLDLFFFFILILLVSVAIVFCCAAFFAFQLVLERFISTTLPIIVDLYGRIRYPDKYLE